MREAAVKGIKDKIVVVTGASSGVGRACSLRLGEEGARLVLVGRNESALEEVAGLCGGDVVAGDLREGEFVKAFTTGLRARKESIHGWVLAAGTHSLRPMMMENTEKLVDLWHSNVGTSLGLLTAALKARLVATGGAVVLFSSAVTRAGGAGVVSYASTKGAIEGAVRSLAIEVSGQGVRVNAVAPGIVQTPMSEAYLGKLPPEQAEHARARHPLGIGSPEDVAGPVAFLLSDDARWITGTTVVVDGGLTAT